MNEEAMTQAQRDAVEKAWDLVSEHFDRCLLVVDWNVEEDGKTKDAQEGFWHGGSMSALGMAMFAQDRILHSGEGSKEPE